MVGVGWSGSRKLKLTKLRDRDQQVVSATPRLGAGLMNPAAFVVGFPPFLGVVKLRARSQVGAKVHEKGVYVARVYGAPNWVVR